MSVRITSSPLGISLGRVAAYAEEHRQLEAAVHPEHGRQRVPRCNEALAAAAADESRRYAISQVVPWPLVLEFVALEDVRPVSVAARFLYAITASAPFWGAQLRRGRFDLASKHFAAQEKELNLAVAARSVDADGAAPALGDIGRGLTSPSVDAEAAKLSLLRFFDPYTAPVSVVQLALATHEDIVDPSSSSLVPPQRLRFFEEVMPLLDRARDAKAEGLKRALAERRHVTKQLVACWAAGFVLLLGGTAVAFALRELRDATWPTALYFVVCLVVIVATLVVVLAALRWPSTRLFYVQQHLKPVAAFFDVGASHAVWCGLGTLLCMLVSAYAFSELDAYAELYLFVDQLPTVQAECLRPNNATLSANQKDWPAYVEVDTNQWSWALDDVHAPYGTAVAARVPLVTETTPVVSYYLLRPLGPLVSPPWCWDAGSVVSARDSPALAVRAADKNATLAALGVRQGTGGSMLSMRTVVAGARQGTGSSRLEDAWRAGRAWRQHGIPLLSGDVGVVERSESLRLFVLAAAVDAAVFGCTLAVFAIFTLAGFRRDRSLFESVRNSRLRKHNPLSTSAASYASPEGSVVFGSGRGGTLVLEDYSPSPPAAKQRRGSESPQETTAAAAPLHRIHSASLPDAGPDAGGAASVGHHPPPLSIQRRRRSTLAPALDQDAVAMRREESLAAVVAAPSTASQHDPYGATPKLLVPFGMTPHVQAPLRAAAAPSRQPTDDAVDPQSPTAGKLPRRGTKAFHSPLHGTRATSTAPDPAADDSGDAFLAPSPLPDEPHGEEAAGIDDAYSFPPRMESPRAARLSLGSVDGIDDPELASPGGDAQPRTLQRSRSPQASSLRLGSLSPEASPLRRRQAPFGMTPMAQHNAAGTAPQPHERVPSGSSHHQAARSVAAGAAAPPPVRSATPAGASPGDAAVFADGTDPEDERTFASAAGHDSHGSDDDAGFF